MCVCVRVCVCVCVCIHTYIYDRSAAVLLRKEAEMLHTLDKERSGDVKKTVKKTRKEDET